MIGKKIVWILDEFTYFLPDIFLVLAIVSIFKDLGKYDDVITILLFITYLSTSYGEYMYHKVKIARDMVDNIIFNHIKGLENQINEKKFVTFDGLLIYSDVIENAMDEKIEELKQEIKGVAEDIEVDSERTSEEVQEK